MTYILMSIRAPFSNLILRGEKTLEIRKGAPKAIREGPLCVLLYESKREGGRGKIVGWFTCRSIRRLWGESEREVCDKACLESWQLRRYASESRRDVAQLYAWQVEDATELVEPVPPDQSRCGLPAPELAHAGPPDRQGHSGHACQDNRTRFALDCKIKTGPTITRGRFGQARRLADSANSV